MHAVRFSLPRMSITSVKLFCRAMAVLLMTVAFSAYAQIDTGTIVGLVQDKNNARLPNATVEVTDMATNVTRTYRTNSEGEYEAEQLIPGDYTVTVKHDGFATAERRNITVNVQSRISVDFVLNLSSVSQQVVVNETASQLQTQSAEVAAVLSTQTVNELPLNGRDYDQLALLEPGTYHDPSAEVANPAEGRFSANGNLELQNYFSLDGIDNNTGSENLQEQSVQAVIPPPDALQEFAVQTRTYSSEFGTSAGAVVNVSTKSGTNTFHGDLWDYVENSAFDANTWFNDYGDIPKGHFEQNQFGATVGGPIVRNHTFFFAAYETLLSREAETELSVVPTQAMKTGDFTSVLSTDPMTTTVPSQAGCITGNIISPGCIDSVGQAILDLFPNPSPQLGNVNAFTGAPNYQYVTSVPNDTRTLDVRIDHTLNAKNQLFGRYANDISDYETAPWTSNPIAGNGEFSTDYILHGQSLALGWTMTPNSSLVNTAHFGYLRDFSHSDPVGLPLGVSDAPNYGLTGVPVTPYSSGIPANYIFPCTTIGTPIYRPQFQVAQVFQVIDDVYKLIGKHSLQFGYEYHENSLNFFDLEAPQGAILAEGVYTDTPGFGIGDYLLGDITEAIVETPLEVNNYIRGNSFYGQDTWRVNPNLTVNYGLRYELYPPFWLNRENRTANFSPANGGEMITATGGNGIYGRALIHPDDIDFAPRAGFSYHLIKPVVLRGGYGIFHQFINRIGSESMLQLNPPSLLDESLAQPFGSTTPVFQLKNGFPAAQLFALGVDLPDLQLRAQDPNERTAYVEQASFGPEFQLSGNTLLDLIWVGNWGRKENRLRNANQGVVTGLSGTTPVITFPYANLNTETTAIGGAGNHSFLELATNDGNTDFNALEVDLKRNFSHRLMYQLGYTWSHNMADYVDNLTGGSTPQNAYDYGQEMANSPQDVRQRFTGGATWILPIGTGGWVLNNNSTAAKLVGGWQANAVVNLQTGIPFDVTAADESDTGSNHAAYANCIGNPWAGTSHNPKDYAGSNATGEYISLAAFSQPGLGTFGTCRPREWHGPGIEEEDLSLFKSFPLGELRKIELRGEFFNAFNRPSFENPSASVSSPGAFGKSTGTTTNPRVLQLVGKFFF